MLDRTPQIEGERWVAVTLSPDDAPALQAFFDANPLYSELAYGRPWPPDTGVQELAERPPADWPQGATRHWAVLERGTGRWLALIAFTEDLLAPHVWHLRWLLVATAEHGSGLAPALDAAWLAHAERAGARWVRLGVIHGNPRAVAFWARQGYVETRLRHDMPYGTRTQTVSVRVKALGDATLEEYLARVARDRPESP